MITIDKEKVPSRLYSGHNIQGNVYISPTHSSHNHHTTQHTGCLHLKCFPQAEYNCESSAATHKNTTQEEGSKEGVELGAKFTCGKS